jgi:hypothetical protein
MLKAGDEKWCVIAWDSPDLDECQGIRVQKEK